MMEACVFLGRTNGATLQGSPLPAETRVGESKLNAWDGWISLEQCVQAHLWDLDSSVVWYELKGKLYCNSQGVQWQAPMSMTIHSEHACSHLISKAKQGWAWLTLWLETTLKYRQLLAFAFHFTDTCYFLSAVLTLLLSPCPTESLLT